MTTTVTTEPTVVRDLYLSRLYESPLNARKTFDAAKLKELAESIKAKGVLTPLLVRLCNPSGKEDCYEILAGARRSRAAELAGLSVVPCVVRDVDDTAALEIITMENLQREDLSEIEEAQGFQALLDLGKYDVAELARRLGKSQSYVYQRVKLVDLAPEAKKALTEKKITAGHAILIARLQPQDQARAMKELKPQQPDGRVLSVRELTDFIQTDIQLDLTKAPWKLDDAKMLPAAGSCEACDKREKKSCMDATCYEAKMRAHFKSIEESADSTVVKVSTDYERPSVDVLNQREWISAKPKSCPHALPALVMDSGWNDGKYTRGQQIYVCTHTQCKVHWPVRGSSGSSSYKRPAAETARIRKKQALEAARGEALRQIVAKAKVVDLARVALKLAERSTFDEQKVACRALGIWPKDGKTGNFDFRKKLTAHVAAQKPGTPGMAQALAALVLAPGFGRWSNEYYSGANDIAALRKAGKAAGVNVEKIEGSFLQAANDKAKRKAKPKERGII